MEQIMSDFETFRSKMSVPKFIKFLSTRIILELNLELIPSSWFNPIWDNHDFHFERWTKTISFHRNITPYGQSDLSKLIILGQIHKYSWMFLNFLECAAPYSWMQVDITVMLLTTSNKLFIITCSRTSQHFLTLKSSKISSKNINFKQTTSKHSVSLNWVGFKYSVTGEQIVFGVRISRGDLQTELQWRPHPYGT